jgi:octaprenyl-diphosphate synthase
VVSFERLKIFDAKDFPSYLPKLNELYDKLFKGGKGFRAHLVHLISGRIGLDEKSAQLLAQTIEFIHNASLLHDDLIDRSPTRRGKTAAWLEFTPEYAVLAGDYLLARVMVNLSSHSTLPVVQYTSQMISDLLEGEWLQDSLVGDFYVGTAELDRVHHLKTASLFKWCLLCPFIALAKDTKVDPGIYSILNEMGSLAGTLFQRADDLLDFDIRNSEGKALLGDLKSGYLNSFAAFVMSQEPESKRASLKNITTLLEFKNLLQSKNLSGEQSFANYVSQFDTQNIHSINLYLHLCEELKLLLKKTSMNPDNINKLTDDFVKLPKVLYWREKP